MDSDIKRLLLLIAELIDKDDCKMCRAHDEHEQCHTPDIAEAIRKAIEMLDKEK